MIPTGGIADLDPWSFENGDGMHPVQRTELPFPDLVQPASVTRLIRSGDT